MKAIWNSERNGIHMGAAWLAVVMKTDQSKVRLGNPRYVTYHHHMQSRRSPPPHPREVPGSSI